MNSAQQRGPALIVERDDDAGVGECLQVELAVAAGGRHRGEKTLFRVTIQLSHRGGNADAASD